MPARRTITVRCTDETIAALDAIAAKDFRKPSREFLIRMALQEFAQKHGHAVVEKAGNAQRRLKRWNSTYDARRRKPAPLPRAKKKAKR